MFIFACSGERCGAYACDDCYGKWMAAEDDRRRIFLDQWLKTTFTDDSMTSLFPQFMDPARISVFESPNHLHDFIKFDSDGLERLFSMNPTQVALFKTKVEASLERSNRW